MTRANLNRRGFLHGGADVGGSIFLEDGAGAAETSLGCGAPSPPLSFGPDVGIRYVEQFSGPLGQTYEVRLQVHVAIESLAEFLAQSHTAEITGGWVEWGPLTRCSIRAGQAQLFRDCGAQAKELFFECEYEEPSGRMVTVRGVRVLAQANQRDPAVEPKKPVLGRPPEHGFYECMVNLVPNGCLGCGMCNTGCGSERKRNALQVHLPQALGSDRDAELVPNARVIDISLADGKPGLHRVESLVVRTAEGTIRVRARQYVLSAGAIHTSALMQSSPSLMRAAGALPIGKRFSANVVTPMLSFYDRVLHHRPSLQLTHYYAPAGEDDGLLIENLFNPPGQSALVMPGYGAVHHERMRSYKSTALTGIAIGTTANGEVRLDSAGRVQTTLPMGENEHRRMRAGFDLLARALLRGGGGARPTELLAGALAGGFRIRTEADVDAFQRWFESIDRIVLSTGHPQGGSAMSHDPRISVVDGQFRVRGVNNLRVCDASLFPLVSGVNPQWTVLAIADQCGKSMNEAWSPG